MKEFFNDITKSKIVKDAVDLNIKIIKKIEKVPVIHEFFELGKAVNGVAISNLKHEEKKKRDRIKSCKNHLDKLIQKCERIILNEDEYDSSNTEKLLSEFETILKLKRDSESDLKTFKTIWFKNYRHNESESEYDKKADSFIQCMKAFIDFYKYSNLDSCLKTLQDIYRENPEIALPFLTNVGCSLARYGNFELALSILFPIRKENPKAIVALADLFFREGENYFLNQNPDQETSEANKKKYQFICTLLKDLKKEDLLDPNTNFILEKSIKGLLSEDCNVFNENGVNISIPGSLWSIEDLKGISQNIVDACQTKGIENENISLLKNLIKDEETSLEYYGFLLALLKSALSIPEVKEACSELQAVKDFQSVDFFISFEMLINCKKEDIKEVLLNDVDGAKVKYDRYKRVKFYSEENDPNHNPERELELFAQTTKGNIIEQESTLFTKYLLKSSGLDSIKNFKKRNPESKSADALDSLSEKIHDILNGFDYPTDEDKLSAITRACLDAKGSIKGFTFFSKGMGVINNFMDKSIENAKKYAAQQGDDLEDSEDKDWVIINNN